MSLDEVVTYYRLRCDGVRDNGTQCVEFFPDGEQPFEDEDKGRDDAAWNGWVYLGGKDYCDGHRP